jgi:hypothetical protein
VIKTIALTLICLAALGAIAGAAKRSTPPLPETVRPIVAGNTADRLSSTPPLPETVRPVVAGNKADRLTIVASEDVPKGAENVDAAYVQPADDDRRSPPAETPPSATSEPSDLRPVKMDELHSAKAPKAHKSTRSVNHSKRMASANQSPKQENAPPSNEVNVVKECSSDGLDPLLRKLNLAPPCN